MTSSPSSKDNRHLAPLPLSPRKTISVESSLESTIPVPVLTVPPVHLYSTTLESTATTSTNLVSTPVTTSANATAANALRVEPSISSPAAPSIKQNGSKNFRSVESPESPISRVAKTDYDHVVRMKPASTESYLNTLQEKDSEESDRRINHQNVTSLDLSDALQLLKYDFHKELQIVMREQVRQFAIAKVRILGVDNHHDYYFCHYHHHFYHSLDHICPVRSGQ